MPSISGGSALPTLQEQVSFLQHQQLYYLQNAVIRCKQHCSVPTATIRTAAEEQRVLTRRRIRRLIDHGGGERDTRVPTALARRMSSVPQSPCGQPQRLVHSHSLSVLDDIIRALSNCTFRNRGSLKPVYTSGFPIHSRLHPRPYKQNNPPNYRFLSTFLSAANLARLRLRAARFLRLRSEFGPGTDVQNPLQNAQLQESFL